MLAFREHVAGMFDAAPGELADVQQAIDAADIDERAEIHELADHAFVDLARRERCQQFFAWFRPVRARARRGG